MKNKKKELTFEERYNASEATAAAAASLFEKLAEDLEEAALHKWDLRRDIEDEIVRLRAQAGYLEGLRTQAVSGESSDLEVAGRIRALVAN